MSEYKPCPFCGEQKGIEVSFIESQGFKWGHAVCCNCGACGPEVRTSYNREPDAPWKDQARKEWNERPNTWPHTCSLHNYTGNGPCPACEQLKKTIGG